MLYLIDSSIYIFRAWRSLPSSIINTYGEQANAVQGFTDTLLHILCQKNPHYIACAFDKSAQSGARYKIFPQYKANRTPVPPELKTQIDRCMQIAKAMGIPVFASTQVEADDIIGSFAQVACKAGQPVTIVSADKDLFQFIGENDTYWHIGKKQQWNYRQLHKRFKIRPDQIADMLALCGDKVDNIPGIDGVGQATAARLLKKWKTLDGVIENHEAIKSMSFRGAPQVAILVKQNADAIRLWRRLTGLIADTALPNTMNELKRETRSCNTIAQQLQAAGVDEHRARYLAGKISYSVESEHVS